jgi:ribonuclease Z
MSNAFRIHILGSSAAIPTSTRFTTSQLINFRSKYFLVDCSEGVQIQLRRLQLPLMKIDHIFISHLHGDHCLGLPGLIFTMHLLGRKKKLHIYSPPGLRDLIDLQYRISKLVPGFSIYYHILRENNQLIYEDSFIRVNTIEMLHSLPSYGFLFTEKTPMLNIDKDAIEKYQIPVEQIPGIKEGKDLILNDGHIIPNHKLTLQPIRPRSYAFCSDTGYTEQYLDQIQTVDVLYHESTFLNDKAEIAKEKTHCTALQAALIAQKASVRNLLLGHFSARYDDLTVFEKEAKTVFDNSFLATEGLVINIEQNEISFKDSEKQP